MLLKTLKHWSDGAGEACDKIQNVREQISLFTFCVSDVWVVACTLKKKKIKNGKKNGISPR